MNEKAAKIVRRFVQRHEPDTIVMRNKANSGQVTLEGPRITMQRNVTIDVQRAHGKERGRLLRTLAAK